jgi:cystathionine beta-lyase
MNKYNFDKIIPRENTGSVKYDFRKDYFGKADVLPMWVADMDFETPEFIVEAVKRRASHPIYGYSLRSEAYYQSFIDWMKARHQWEIQKDWICFSPGVVPGINFAILAYSKEEEGIIIQPPVYYPFFEAVESNGRQLIENQMILQGQHYEIDFNDLEKKAKHAKLLLLSNPHNPTGRCFTQDELQRIGDICLRNQLIIISDEIHGDLILPGNKHIPMASISDEIAEITVTCMAPSKTFNMAGLATSSIIIPNKKLRKAFQHILVQLHIQGGNLFGYEASIAAYEKGAEWVDQLMTYVHHNFQYLEQFLKTELPHLKLIRAEGTYLAWIDFRETGLSDEAIKDKLIFEAGLGLNHGPIFGTGGEGFQRMNLAAPFSTIKEACARLKKTF